MHVIYVIHDCRSGTTTSSQPECVMQVGTSMHTAVWGVSGVSGPCLCSDRCASIIFLGQLNTCHRNLQKICCNFFSISSLSIVEGCRKWWNHSVHICEAPKSVLLRQQYRMHPSMTRFRFFGKKGGAGRVSGYVRLIKYDQLL